MAPTASGSQSQAQTLLRLPSEKTVAFAMAVVQSTPGDITIREYIGLLQQHVAKGRRENRLSSVYRHLDASSYWRMEAKKANDERRNQKRELDAQRITNETLKRKCDDLEAELEAARPTTSKGRKKAKNTDEDVRPIPNVPYTASSERETDSENQTHELYSEYPSLDENGKDIVRCLYNIHSQLKKKEQIDLPQLMHHLNNSASVVLRIIQANVKSCVASEQATLRSTLVALQRMASSMIAGFNHLGPCTEDEPFRGIVIHAFATMFAKLLATLDDMSEAETKKLAHAKATTTTTKKNSAGNIRETQAMGSLTSFICAVIDSLDPKNESHKELFEAFAYVVLEKIGKTLFISVFGHARAATIEQEIANCQSYNGETNDENENSDVSKAKFEAPYLVYLLKRLMATAPGHLGASINTKGKPKSVTSKTSGKSALALLARDKLQNTLLACMFGTEDTGKDDPLGDCLKMPVSSAARIPMPPKAKQTELKEWFQEEVWQLLGWEILSRDGD